MIPHQGLAQVRAHAAAHGPLEGAVITCCRPFRRLLRRGDGLHQPPRRPTFDRRARIIRIRK